MIRPDNLGRLNLEIHPDALVVNQANRAGKTPEESRILKAKDFKLPLLTRCREGTSKESFYFVQAVAPKFGLAAHPEENTDAEKATMEKLTAALNKMKPSPRFLVIYGGFTNAKPNEKEYFLQLESFKFSLDKISPDIPVVCVCGDTDCGELPTLEGIEAYRENFGEDWFSFWVEGVQFIVLNTTYFKEPRQTAILKAEQWEWFESKLLEAQVNPPKQVILFQNLPWFCNTKDEPDNEKNIDSKTRQEILPKLKEANVRAVFAGSLNGVGKDGEVEMILTSSLGKSVEEEIPGFRIVKVMPDRIFHKFFPLDNSPEDLNLELE